MKDSDWHVLYELEQLPNITQLAKKLFITQPTLTKKIQNMEEEFHVTILERTKDGVTFTPEGEVLLQYAKEYIQLMNRLRNDLLGEQGRKRKIIRIGASYTYSKYMLNELLYLYRINHPDVQFEVINDQSNILFRKACDGEVDIAFVQGDYTGDVTQKKLDEYQAYILTSKKTPLEDIIHMTKIDYKMNDRSKDLLNGWWKEKYAVIPEAGMHAGYVDVAWQLAAKGVGYACCFLPKNFPNKYHLYMKPMIKSDGTLLARNTWLVYKEKERQSEHLIAFIQYMGENTDNFAL